MWIASLENKLRKADDNIVISDVRFKNEVAMLRNLGAVCVEVTRFEKPDWYQIAIGGGSLEDSDIHRSEYDWIGTKFNHTLDNNGSMDQLYEQIESLLSNYIIHQD
jgi:hypothetical protein